MDRASFIATLCLISLSFGCNSTNFGGNADKNPKGLNATGGSNSQDGTKPTGDGDGNDGDDLDNPGSDDDDDNTKDVDDEIEKKKDPTGLTITSLERDDDTKFVIQTLDGKSVTIDFPDEGQTIVVPNVCNVGKPTTLEMKAITEKGETRALTEAQCFLGKRKDEKSVYIGFEDDCNSLKASKIDEEIGLYSCPDSELKVPGLRMDDSVSIDDWD